MAILRSLRINSIPEGPMPTVKAKWAAIAKYHAINDERKKKGFEEIPIRKFCKWTHIDEEDVSNASTHKDYIEAAMSLAKGESTMWFRNELPYMREAAEKLRAKGDDKDYLRTVMEIAGMLKFKDVDMEGMDDSEAKTPTEIIEEVLTLLKDESVKNAFIGGEVVPQKIVYALVNTSFRPNDKNKTKEATLLGDAIKEHSEKRPDQPMDTVRETEDRTVQP